MLRPARALAIGAVLLAAAAPSAVARWHPRVGSSWQIQLQGKVSLAPRAAVYEIDGFDSPRSLVRALHRRGRRAICYIDAGSWESYRSDSEDFPEEVLGKAYVGYPDERWLDIRRIDLLGPILSRRIAACAAKGFDAVDPDNLNGFENDTGFPLSAADQMRFNRWIASAVHRRGMAVGLKNDGPQARRLAPAFDFAVVESCFQYRECSPYRAFVRAGKPVFAIEYKLAPARFCTEARRLGFSAIRKRPSLDSHRLTC